MKLFFICFFSAFVMFLASCKETSVQENASVNVEEETKLVVDVKDHFSLRVPKDWFVKKFDSKIDFVTYNIDGPFGHIFLYVGNFPQSHLYWNGSLSVGKVVSVGTRDDFDFGGASDAPYKVHMMAMGTTSVNSVLYFEFSYNPQNSDTVACEKVITSLQYLKEAPADAENVIDVIQYGRRDKLAMKDILCDSCTLQDSLDAKNNRLAFFECSFEDVEYRFVSDASAKWDTLTTIEFNRKKDSSLKKCKAPVLLKNRVSVGAKLSDYEKIDFVDFEKDGNHWLLNKKEKYYCSDYDCYHCSDNDKDCARMKSICEIRRPKCDLKYFVEHTDLYFLNDTLSRVIYSWRRL